MGSTCSKWYSEIGCKSTLDKEQYTHLVWRAALASKVENFTYYNRESVPFCNQCADPEYRESHNQCDECGRKLY